MSLQYESEFFSNALAIDDKLAAQARFNKLVVVLERKVTQLERYVAQLEQEKRTVKAY